MTTDRILGWHFLPEDGKLANGDGRLVTVGKTYSHDGPIEICSSGLHASRRIIDALRYAPGPILCRVEVWGDVQSHADKVCAWHRRVIAMADATETLRAFARLCALDVAHLWDMPDIVRRYLETGDESIRAAARAAARDAAWAAAWAAARVAAWDAAWDAAWAAAWDASWAAARAAAWAAARVAARVAARDAAVDAAMGAQNTRLTEMALALLGITEDQR